MKVILGTGVYPGPGAKPNGIIDFNQKQLAAYLARCEARPAFQRALAAQMAVFEDA